MNVKSKDKKVCQPHELLERVRSLDEQYRAAEAQGTLHELLQGKNVDKKDWIAPQTGLGRRQAQRYLRILDMPKAVQEAVKQEQLSVKVADTIGSLPADAQADIAREIEAGGQPGEVIAKHLASKPVDVNQEYQQLMDCLASSIPRLRGKVRSIRRVRDRDIETMDATVRLFAEAREQVQAECEANRRTIARILGRNDELAASITGYEKAKCEQESSEPSSD